MFNYYDVLGVPPSANGLQIKRAYRQRVKRLHPDVVSDDAALRKVKVLNRAYAVLRDRSRRAEYDASVRLSSGSYICSTSASTSHLSYRWAIVALIWLVAAGAIWFFTQPRWWPELLERWLHLPIA